jgi:pimeloyl-ACP methyl ester carboxylesterase
MKRIAGSTWRSALRFSPPVLLFLASMAASSVAQPLVSPPANICGEVVTIATHDRTTTRYAFAQKPDAPARGAPIALVLLVGGGGVLDLDGAGCPRALARNSLIRMRPFFHDAGFVTALVDAPSDVRGENGLAGFRTARQHAADLGKVIADLRSRTHGQVWLVGHSRGTISAANAAARLSGASAPDGLVLLSAMMSGDASRRKPFVAQTVFDPPLEAITVPVLVIGHEADNCLRSPARLMGAITARTRGVRQQAVAVAGGPIKPGRAPNIADCGVGEPHDFVAQEAEVAAGILRFIGGVGY